MKLIKRRTQMVYKEITEQEWQQAYVKYLEIRVMRNNSGMPVYNSFEDFKLFAANIWCPIREVEKDIETEEEFVRRVTKTNSKGDEYNSRIQFIANGYGEVVSCVLS